MEAIGKNGNRTNKKKFKTFSMLSLYFIEDKINQKRQLHQDFNYFHQAMNMSELSNSTKSQKKRSNEFGSVWIQISSQFISVFAFLRISPNISMQNMCQIWSVSSHNLGTETHKKTIPFFLRFSFFQIYIFCHPNS